MYGLGFGFKTQRLGLRMVMFQGLGSSRFEDFVQVGKMFLDDLLT